MNFTRCTLIAMFLTLSAHAHAQAAQTRACLSSMPEYLQSTVEQDNWKILQPQDLAADDLPVFKGNHPGLCPGVAAGNFYPKADSSFIVALIQRNDQNILLEKTILVTMRKNKTETAVVIPPAQVAALAVVWRVPPGHWRGLYGTKTAISRDSFVSEQIISTATQFYYDGKHLKSFVISR